MTVTYAPRPPIWCAGCGHFGVQAALDRALGEAGIPPEATLILAGIGCSGTIQNNLGTYGYHALHGRVLPAATGAALADPSLTVIAAGGDGDGYAIGAGHLVHTFRRNPALTYLLMNNATYGLTKGQGSPTAALVHPEHREQALDGILLGLGITASTFLARGYSGRPDQLLRLIAAALDHARAGRGFGFVEVLSPCVTYQDTYPAWDAAVADLDEETGYDPSDRAAAFATCLRVMGEGRIPTGIVYRGGPAAFVPDPGPAALDLAAATEGCRTIMDGYRV
ncbi:MAG: 2-oxoacid:ferredoxin oxidoreductase subunit beta [Acidimicrobiia bacterium]|nr:2-oxoacid:ferredoxin oxidoreductase subunit beta [Acidimicrobiia bacterium]